jgi:hypothetical protein
LAESVPMIFARWTGYKVYDVEGISGHIEMSKIPPSRRVVTRSIWHTLTHPHVDRLYPPEGKVNRVELCERVVSK